MFGLQVRRNVDVLPFRAVTGIAAQSQQEAPGRVRRAEEAAGGQIGGLLESIDGKGLSNEDQIRTTAGQAQDQLATLSNEVRRPPDGMGYRDWPRIIEQLRFVSRGINGPQARPTEGQLDVLTEVEAAAAQRAEELSTIVNGVIADLNELLADAPKILTDWRRTIS